MKMYVILLSLLMIFFSAPPAAQHEKALTTIIVLRHAEKSDTGDPTDPDLSEEGKKRAIEIADLLSRQEINALYATPYARSIQTLTPLADNKQLQVKKYHPVDPDGFSAILEENRGKTIVICGHSNTLPLILKHYDSDYEILAIEENSYNQLFIIARTSGEEATTTRLSLIR